MADNFNISDIPPEAGPKSVEVPGDIADGTEGDILSWDAAGVAAVAAKSGTPGFVLTENAAGVPTFQAGGGGGGGVTTFEGRSGAVVSAVGDYSFTEISGIITDAQHGARAGGTLHANVIAAGAAGFMTGADKTKLDGLGSGAFTKTETILTSGDVSITAGSFTDVTGAVIPSFTPAAGEVVLVYALMSCVAPAGGDRGRFDILHDNSGAFVSIFGTTLGIIEMERDLHSTSFAFAVTLAAASATVFKLQGEVDGDTMVLRADTTTLPFVFGVLRV